MEELVKKLGSTKTYVVLCLFFLLGLYLNWRIRDIAALVFVVWLILETPRPKFFAITSLLALLLIPVLVIFGKMDRAEQIAELAFLLFGTAVILHTYFSIAEKPAETSDDELA